jgi:DNA-binding NarL/FixJ family response regulator
MYGNEEYVLQALRSGASGYLLKDAAIPELELALRAVVRGETYLSPPVSKHVVSHYLQRVGGDAGPLDMLTPRQREVLQLIAEGYSTQQIAQALTVSVKTVETHRMHLMDRLGIHDIAGLVRFAVQVGMVPPHLSGAP